MFKTGDRVKINIPTKQSIIAEIISPVHYNSNLNIIIYKVELENGMKLRVPDTRLLKHKKYDGNELTNWADIRHIWRPK